MNSMNPRVVKTNVKAFEALKDQSDSGFGRRIEVSRKLEEWKADPRTRSTHISQKQKSVAQAIREFKDLYEVEEFFAAFGKNDDSFEVFYRKKASARKEVFTVEFDGEAYTACVPGEYSEYGYPFTSARACFDYLVDLRKKLGPAAQKYPLVPLSGAL